jgi:hypothetical protein
MNRSSFWPRWLSSVSLLLIFCTCISALLVFIALGQYAYPVADDFCMAVGVRDEGLFSHLWQHYQEWSGRYFGNALYAVYPLVFGMFEGYALLPGMIIFALYLACVFLLSSIFELPWRKPANWLVALLLVCGFILGLRHTASSLYWMASVLTYQSANILLLLTLAFMIRLFDRQQRHQSTSANFLVLILLLVSGAGTNEINLIVLTLLTAGVYLSLAWTGANGRNSWLALLVVTLACFAVVYLAPGTGVRESTFPLRHDWLRSIKGSLDMGMWTLLVWTGNPVFMLCSLLTPFAVTWLYQSSKREITVSNRWLWLFLLLCFLLPVALQFPAWWSMGGWPPPRTVDAIFFVFYVCWFALLGALTIRFMPMRWLFTSVGQITTRASVALFIISSCFVLSVFFVSAKFNLAWNDLRYKAAPFYDYMMQRHALINASRQQGVYYINVPAPAQALPRSIYFNDIRSDWRDWRNVCYADYFGLRGIQRLPFPQAK